MDIYRKLYRYLKPYIWRLIWGLISLIFVGLADLSVPWLIKFLIDDVLISGNTLILNYIALGAVLLFFIKGIFYYLQTYLLSGLGEKVVVDIRKDLYQHLQGLSLSFYERQRLGDLMSRLTNDVNVIQQSITIGLSSLVLQPIMVVGIIGFLIYINWKLAIVAFLIIPMAAYAINIFGNKMRHISTNIQEKMSMVTAILQETLSGIRIVKAFNNEKLEIERFFEANDETLEENIKGVKIRATITPLVEFIIALGLASFLWYGGFQVLKGHMTTGELITFLGYIGLLISPINVLSNSYSLFQRAIGASERIFNLLEIDERVLEVNNPVKLPEIEGKVCFENVYFSYNEDEDVLKNINLDVEPGKMVAIVGHSGAGKTSLANLIPRFYDLDSGRILIDNYDIKKVSLKSLRSQIGIVPQETILFSGTIADNIAYGAKKVDREDIIEASEKANADEFIKKYKNSYDAEVGERGVSLSGGQKQRISIARAILTNPRILILDEATSSLDARSETLVQEALERLMKGRTTFVIAHRFSTIIEADSIIVLKKGRIVEMGKHDELLAKEGDYYHLYRAQLD